MNSLKKLNFLIISHRFYPEINARAFRWTSLAKYFIKQGHNVFVITSLNNNVKHDEIYSQIHIKRALDLTNLLFTQISRNNTKELTKNKKKNFSLKKIAKLFYNKIIKKLYWPDQEFLWIFPAFFSANKILKKGKIDVIITVARPFSSHIVGLLLNGIFKKTWICDIGDPFSFDKIQKPNNLFLYEKLNKYIERKIFLKSKKISVTTEETKRLYCETLNVNESYVKVIPPLYSLSKGENTYSYITKNKTKGKEIKLIFLGTLYKDIRNPKFLLNILEKIILNFNIELTIHFYGSIFDCEEEFIKLSDLMKQKVIIHGKVNRDVVSKVMNEADVLVNIGNKTSYQLPSKIIEYISTGKPILHIASVNNDSSIAVLDKYDSAFIVYEDKNISKGILEELYNFIVFSKQVEKNNIKKILSEYSLSAVGNQYFSFIE